MQMTKLPQLELADQDYELELDSQETDILRELARSSQQDGGDSSRYCKCLYELAQVYLCQRKFKRAEKFYRELLMICLTRFGRNDIRVVATLNGLSYAMAGQNKMSEAENAISKALSIVSANRPLDDPRKTAAMLTHLAQVQMAQGRYQEAEINLIVALSTMQELVASDSDEGNLEGLLDTLNTLIDLLAILQRKEDAIGLMARRRRIGAQLTRSAS